MIIKFDHITYVCAKLEVDKVLENYYIMGYRKKFSEIGLENISIKRPLCKYKHQTHDLYYLFCENKLSVEVVSYDMIYQSSVMKLDDDIIAFAEDIIAVEKLLLILGAKAVQTDHIFNIKGIFDKFDVMLQIQSKEDTGIYYLDSGGLGCITLLVDSLEKIQKRIMNTEYIYSRIEKLCVNNEVLNIMFVSTPNRELIFELISKL